jgi:hypothetical protein
MNMPNNGENAAPVRSSVPIFPFPTAAGLAGNYSRLQPFFTVRPTLQAGSAAWDPTGGGHV